MIGQTRVISIGMPAGKHWPIASRYGLRCRGHPPALLEVELRLADELRVRRAVHELGEPFAQVDEPGSVRSNGGAGRFFLRFSGASAPR